MDKGTFRIVNETTLQPSANILDGIDVLVLKSVGTEEETYKARFAAQKHKNAEKNMIIYSSKNLKQQSIRLMISFRAVYELRLWTQNISQAYIQSRNPLS